MLVKNKVTGEKIEKSTAYAVPTYKKDGTFARNEYFSSEEEYLKYEEDKNNRLKCINVMRDIADYESFQKMPSLFYKRLSELEHYGYDVIYECMVGMSEQIQFVCRNKLFDSETSKLCYVMGIIHNHINDYYKKSKIEKRKTKDNYVLDDVPIMDVGVTKNKTSVAGLLGNIDGDY